MQESQHDEDQITFKATILPHNSPGPHVLSLLPVVPISRAVRVGAAAR